MQPTLNQLESQLPGSYSAGGPPATEPTAWAAMALAAAGRNESAGRAAAWLAEQQLGDGSVGVAPDSPAPQWSTSLAILAWHQVDLERYGDAIQRAATWCLKTEGTTNPRHEYIGHDSTLIGWSWAADTHSWLEPTAFAVMALRAAGQTSHTRTTEGIRLLVDRLLPTGGCNYGNTRILGQTLLPHLQPSGAVAWALAGTDAGDPRIAHTLAYLEQQLSRPTGCASLAYALLALTAWGRRPPNAEVLIREALHRPATKNSAYKMALLTLATNFRGGQGR